MNKKIDIPVELYARLQELSHLARYKYTEQEGTWTIQNPKGESLLDARRTISPEAAELYFTIMPLLASEFIAQNEALVTAYRNAPKPAAVKPTIKPSGQQLIPLLEVPHENQRIAEQIENDFYGDVPPGDRIYPVLPGVIDHMMRNNLGYALVLELITAPDSERRDESAQENRFGREVQHYSNRRLGYTAVLNANTSEVISVHPFDGSTLSAPSGHYELTPDAEKQLSALGLTAELVERILEEANDRRPIPGTNRTVYSLHGYSVEFSNTNHKIVSVRKGVVKTRNPFESQPRMRGTKSQRGVKIPHDIHAFKNLLESHGFTITMGGKHYDIRHEKLAPGMKATTSVTPSDSQRWHLNSARQIREIFGVDLRYANPKDTCRGIVHALETEEDFEE